MYNHLYVEEVNPSCVICHENEDGTYTVVYEGVKCKDVETGRVIQCTVRYPNCLIHIENNALPGNIIIDRILPNTDGSTIETIIEKEQN